MIKRKKIIINKGRKDQYIYIEIINTVSNKLECAHILPQQYTIR